MQYDIDHAFPPFKPAWWLRNAHTQTLWPYLFQKKLGLPIAHERLELPDGDFIDLCHIPQQSNTIIIILHGLEGSIESHYARGIIRALHKRGWQVVFMHFRGCSGEHNRLERSYHSGDTGDIKYVVDTLRHRHPEMNLFAVGYSLGGNVLLKYLGETADRRLLKGAVAVSVPFELARGAQRLATGLSRLYQRHLLKRLQTKIISKFNGTRSPIALDKVHELDTFVRFDDAVTAPLHGFKDANDYYFRCSSRRFLRNITVPTLIIHARDDPFLTPDAIPDAQELSGKIRFELLKHGGHVGFISGNNPFKPVYWLEQRIPAFIREVTGDS